MATLHFPALGLGPLHLEWTAAAYERMQARRDACVDCECGSCAVPSEACTCEPAYCASAPHEAWSDPYVKAALAVERRLLGAIHAAGRGRNLPWDERKRL